MIRWAARMVWRMTLGGVALAAIAVALAAYLAQRSLPDYRADRTVAGVAGPVEILRDVRATPHIFAERDEDVFFGLGYAHAQDRLWQMTLRRRIVQGRLTETFGWAARLGDRLDTVTGGVGGGADGLLRLDIALRALDLHGHAERSLDALSPGARAALQAYSDGVNARLQEVNDGALGAGAPEILALGLSIAPWRPVDSVAQIKLLGATLSARFIEELHRGALAIALTPERLNDLFPTEATPAGPGRAAASALRDPGAAAFERWAAALGAPVGDTAPSRLGASNAWAVAADRAAARAPLLASDPHLPLTAPSLWYVARLDLTAGAVIGATMPGVPAVLIGRNEQVAWGLTTLHADVADVVLEQVRPEDPDQYRTPDGWARFETRTETIGLGGGAAVEVALRRTRNGPVMPLDWPAVARVTPPGHVATLRWTLLSDSDASLEAAMGLMTAASVEDALAMAEDAVAPPQTVILADRRGIAQTVAGRLPLRRPEHETRGALPARGWVGANDWVGALSAAQAPRRTPPENGALANANNRVGDRPWPYDLAQHWPAGYRHDRVQDLLAAREIHSVASFRDMQTDTVSAMARRVLPLIANPLFATREQETGLRAEALARLAVWDGDMDAVAAEPLIFSAWIRALTPALTADDLGPRAPLLGAARPRFLETVFSDPEGAGARWCDDLRTPGEESCADVASRALDTALAELEAAHGPRLDRWRWGVAHAAHHRHQPFSEVPGLSALFDIRHELGGGDHTLSRAQSGGAPDAPYRTVHGAGFRAVFDFADLDRSVFALATGQSGHFLSRHYDDFVDLWRIGEYAPLSILRRDVETGSVGVTWLRPPEAPAGAEASETPG